MEARDGPGSRPSGRARVAVVQAAEVRRRDDAAALGRFDYSRMGALRSAKRIRAKRYKPPVNPAPRGVWDQPSDFWRGALWLTASSPDNQSRERRSASSKRLYSGRSTSHR